MSTVGHRLGQGPKMPARTTRALAEFSGRERFEWREPSHPLIRKKAKREDGVHVLSCPGPGPQPVETGAK